MMTIPCPPPLFPLIASSAEKTGQYTGQILWILLFLWGIWKCASIMRRPATHTICVSGLLVYLTTGVLGRIANTVLEETGNEQLSPFVILMVFLGYLAAVILGILGLCLYASQKDQFNQGKKQAIWTLVLAGLTVSLMIGGFMYGLTKGTAKPASNYTSSANQFSIQLDRPGWVRWDEVRDDYPSAEIGAAYRNSGALVVIATPFDEDLTFSPEEVTAGLGRSFDYDFPGKSPRWKKAKEENASGHGVYTIRETSDVDGELFHYRFRTITTTTHGYIVGGWIAAEQGKENLAELEETLATFAVGQSEARSDWASTPPDPDFLMREFYNDVGIHLYSAEQYGKAERLFKRAFEKEEDRPIILTNVLQCAVELEQPVPALKYAAPHIEKLGDSADLQIELGLLREMNGDAALAIAHFDRAFSEQHVNDDALLSYLKLLVDEENYDKAISVLDDQIDSRPLQNLRQWRAEILGLSGDIEGAIAVIEDLKQDFPDDETLEAEIVDIHYEAEDYQTAINYAKNALKKTPNNFSLLYAKGQAEYELEWYKQAKDSFSAALKIVPDDPDTEWYIEETSAMLGQGDQSDITEPITPVTIPEALAANANAPSIDRQRDERTEADGLALRSSFVGVEFKPDTAMRTTKHRTVEILNRRGVEKMSTLEFGFNALHERIFVNTVRVTDVEGKLIAEGDPSSYYVRDESGSGMATNDRILHVTVPGLAPGAILEYTITREDRGTSDTLSFDRLHLYHSARCDFATVFLRASPDDFTAVLTGDCDRSEGEGWTAWSMTPAPFSEWEPYSADLDTYSPNIAFGHPGDNWHDLSAEYLKELEDRLKPEDEVTKMAETLIEEKQTGEEDWHALARHIREGYAYQAIEFGTRARIPNRASQVLSDRYGDCKDHSLLLAQLLRARGIAAELALVDTGSPLVEEIPTLDQFNHMIVFLPEIDGGRFYDPTDKFQSFANLAPAGIGEQTALILDPSDPRLAEIPAHALPDVPPVVVERTVMISSDSTDPRIAEKVTFNGYYAKWMRRYLDGVKPSDYAESISDTLRTKNPITIDEVIVTALDDPESPLIIETKSTATNALIPNGESASLRLPFMWEEDYLWLEPTEERVRPIDIDFPLKLVAKTTFVNDGGRPISAVDFPTVKETTPLFGYSAAVQGTVITTEATLRAGQGEPNTWAPLSKALTSYIAPHIAPIKIHFSTK